MLIKTKIGQKREADILGRWEFCLFWGGGWGRPCRAQYRLVSRGRTGTGKPCSLPTAETEYCEFARQDLGASGGSDRLRVPGLPAEKRWLRLSSVEVLMPRGAGHARSEQVMLSSPKNQGAELPPGAGLISCAVGRFTGLGGRPLPPQKTDTASLLVPWDTLVSAETSLVYLKDLTFSHFGQSTEGTEATTINVRTWVHPLLTS